MSELNTNINGFFNNPEIHFKDKATTIGVLTHGTTDFYKKEGQETVMVMYFGADRLPVGTITATFGNNDSMGKNNGRASVQGKVDKALVDLFGGILDDCSKYTDSEVIKTIVQNRPFKNSLRTQGSVDEWNRLIEPKFRRLFDSLKNEYPDIVNENLINTIRDKYLEEIENSKKKQPLTASGATLAD